MMRYRYRYGHPGYRYGVWANDMEDDRIDMVILEIDMGYIVTLPAAVINVHKGALYLVHFLDVAAQLRFEIII